jgi:hypothetical protein
LLHLVNGLSHFRSDFVQKANSGDVLSGWSRELATQSSTKSARFEHACSNSLDLVLAGSLKRPRQESLDDRWRASASLSSSQNWTFPGWSRLDAARSLSLKFGGRAVFRFAQDRSIGQIWSALLATKRMTAASFHGVRPLRPNTARLESGVRHKRGRGRRALGQAPRWIHLAAGTTGQSFRSKPRSSASSDAIRRAAGQSSVSAKYVPIPLL